MRNRNNLMVAIWFLILMLTAGVVAQDTEADSEGAAAATLTPEIALARLCISEANWDCFTTGDGYAIHEVILRGAAHQDVRYQTYARAYARRLFGARPHDVPRLRWVGQLTPACTEPEAWPTTVTHRNRDGSIEIRPHAPWRSFRARCLAVFERAREVVVEMTLDDVDEWAICERPVHDWGGWMDRERAVANGLVEVDCDTFASTTNDAGEVEEVRIETANDFYCRPSLDPGCVEADRD